jgi:hypothetical protein
MFSMIFLVALMGTTLSQAIPIALHVFVAANTTIITLKQATTQKNITGSCALSDEKEKKGYSRRLKFQSIFFVCLAVIFIICVAASLCGSKGCRNKGALSNAANS